MANTCLDLKIELERGVVVDRIGVLEAILIFLSRSSFLSVISLLFLLSFSLSLSLSLLQPSISLCHTTVLNLRSLSD